MMNRMHLLGWVLSGAASLLSSSGYALEIPLEFIKTNNAAWVRKAIEKGADVNAKSSSDRTPLMYAAMYKSLDAAKILRGEGADLGAKNEDSKTALTVAKDDGYDEMVTFLREHGAE